MAIAADYDYETQLNKIKEAQRQSAIADLENTKNQALSDIQAEREQNAANFNAQRSQANAQNQLAAKNFREYLVNTGRSNSGIGAQYEMNRQNNLQRSINDINSSQNMALADLNRRGTLANQNYNTGLQGANAQIEANYLNNLLSQQQQQWNREMQEKQYNENVRQYDQTSNLNQRQLEEQIRQYNETAALNQRKLDEEIRQYNENLALQRQQLANQSSRSYSSGGSSSSNSSGPALTTAYWSGDYNPDVKYGTFSNGYQPNNVNGNKLTGTGEYIDKIGKTLQGTTTTTRQQIWKTSDGTRYYWDGNQNKYIKM